MARKWHVKSAERTAMRLPWSHALRRAVEMTGEPATSAAAGNMARVFFNERDRCVVD